jgi:hypothetical protein
MRELAFWAQALDNVSPDPMEFHGTELTPDERAHREDVVSGVSLVIKAGARIFETHGVKLTADQHHFVLEVPSAQRDQARRIAPIVCYGGYDSTVDDDFVRRVAEGLDNFANRIGRSLQSDTPDLVRKSFDDLKKSPRHVCD